MIRFLSGYHDELSHGGRKHFAGQVPLRHRIPLRRAVQDGTTVGVVLGCRGAPSLVAGLATAYGDWIVAKEFDKRAAWVGEKKGRSTLKGLDPAPQGVSTLRGRESLAGKDNPRGKTISAKDSRAPVRLIRGWPQQYLAGLYAIVLALGLAGLAVAIMERVV